MARKTHIIGNWKMHGLRADGVALACAIANVAQYDSLTVVICPPATLLSPVAEALNGSSVACGGQDCHAATEGAHTGDISAAMLKDCGATYVIVGHSERRADHGETSRMVSRKAEAVLKAGLIPILCVGETLADRESGKALEVVGQQLRESMPRDGDVKRLLIAYEPVWAIGSGKVPKPQDISEIHTHLETLLKSEFGFAETGAAVLYGGSVKAANAAEILGCPGVSGVLVGGASLDATEFSAIIAAAAAKN